ncbi:MAG: ATP-dependent RecD-like DNA helicase [Clostridia bacterium]|nr:ATP-dependent RecD-like DNA helicase [Clostridia bacterium]MBQ2499951.1 ATP-dependent RecD-like DNA helicase [Clostridia bacterium]
MDNLFGVAEEIIYRKEDTGYTVLDVASEDGELITVVGVLPEIAAGEEVHFTGSWDRHPTFGRQFRAESVERAMPSTAATMLKYLSSGAVKGVGPSTAVKIIEAFGEDAFDVIENDPERLAKIRGITAAKAKAISEEFRKTNEVREIMIKLEALGLTANESINVFRVFGGYAVLRVTENPYMLCIPEIGISFERADAIAAALPQATKPEYRIEAGILHVVAYNLSSNGHTCLPREKMLSPCADLLDIDKDTIDIAMDTLVEQRQLTAFEMDGKEYLSLPYIHEAECMAAYKIKMMVKFPPAGRRTLDKEIEKLEKANGITYEKLQKEAIMTAAQKGVLILTGGPGTGKTTTVNGILELFERDGLNVVLCAPTGRAAQRMSEITGKEASTIHRLLEAERGSDDRMAFKRNEKNPIEADVLIVDELSMVDVILFSALLSALPIGCRLIMVGDNDQLPAVGAGSVLHDLLESGLLPVVELSEVFRQAMQSLIVTNAHRIVSGEEPDLSRVDNDFFHMERESSDKAVYDIIDLYRNRLPKAYGYDPVKDIQVLCPSRKGDAGTANLNRLLQEAVNPPAKGKNEYKNMARTFREGDKVMQIKNNYDIVWERRDARGKVEQGEGIFNGDIGTLLSIDRRAAVMKIDFGGRVATYPAESFKELELAYAVTVHKSQGSEFEAVIMPVIGVPPNLCYRNLFYTAVTRAKSKMITIGTRETILRMVENDRKIKRYSALKYLLKAE